MIIEQTTPSDYNRELTVRALKATLHLAITLNKCYQLFWGRDPQVIIDSINANVPITLERFGANSQLGTAVNIQLEKTGDTIRVIVAMPEGYAFDGLQFTYTPVIAESEQVTP